MANPDPQPWAPDPDVAPGAPPRAGGDGERGTAAFEGSAQYNADYTPVNPTHPARGPAVGTSYYANEFPQAVPSGAGTTSVRESAGSES